VIKSAAILTLFFAAGTSQAFDEKNVYDEGRPPAELVVPGSTAVPSPVVQPPAPAEQPFLLGTPAAIIYAMGDGFQECNMPARIQHAITRLSPLSISVSASLEEIEKIVGVVQTPGGTRLSILESLEAILRRIMPDAPDLATAASFSDANLN